MFQHRSVPSGLELQCIHHPLFGSRPVLAATLTAAALTLGLPASGAEAQEELEETSIIFETNATDCDVGIQIFLDGDGWRKTRVEDPDGDLILETIARNGLRRQGLTELFMESEEPVIDELAALDPDCDPGEASFDDIFDNFPEGTYVFSGATSDGERLSGEAELTYDLPAAPEVTSPMEDDVVDPTVDLIVRWEPVTDTLPGLPGSAGQVNIIGYQVIVEQDVDDPPVYTVDKGKGATKARVSSNFLKPEKEYKLEVLAIEESGNQTITEVPFETGPK